MNKFFKYMICCLLPLTAISCLQEEIDVVRNESIVLTFGSGAMTKAADTDAEAFVAHVDVMIFSADESKVHHERVSNDGVRTFALKAERSSFTAGTGYYVYLVANSSLEASAYASLADINALKGLVQSDSGVMFTGLANSPQHFLMDAVAYTADAEPASPGTVVLNDGVASNSTMLNAVFRRAAAKVFITIRKGADVVFADAENSTTAAYFMRNCPFKTTVIDGYDINADLETPGQMPQNANFVWSPDQIMLAAYGYEHKWENESIHDMATTMVVNVPLTCNGTFYANNWYKIPVSQSSSLERNHYYSVTVTVNAPGAENKENPQEVDNVTYEVLPWEDVTISVGDSSNNPQYLQLNTDHVDMYNVNRDDSTLEFASSSEISSIELLEAYYFDYLDQRINLSENDKYNVYGLINAVAEQGVLNGSITITSPFTGLSDAEIIAQIGLAPEVQTIPKEPINPEITQAPNPADFLKTNTNRMQYQYVQNNDGTYTFQYRSKGRRGNSWSEWRNDQETQEEWDAAVAAYNTWNNKTAEEKQAAIADYQILLARYNAAVASHKALEDYNKLFESLQGNSHSNAIRYLKFKVVNEDGLEAEFTVAQYPTLYITNEHGWYSYRDDFGGTTYETPGTGVNACSGYNINNDTWTYHTEDSYGSRRFQSKVYDSEDEEVDYYYWEGNSVKHINYGDLTNPRMYHVHVTSTSSLYTVAVPRLDSNGYTESSSDNAKLVSPSFMIASQLGATTSPGSVAEAKSHCHQYVEVTQEDENGNKQVYTDWRLPTAAEVEIIIQHQYVSDAMAEVLSGRRYWCAYTDDGYNYVSNTQSTSTSNTTAVRCVRDVF